MLRPRAGTHAALVGALVALCVAEPAARAQAEGDPGFWAWLSGPEHPVIAVVIEAARENRSRAEAEFAPYDHTGLDWSRAANRRALLEDSRRMLEHALALSPTEPALLRELGYVAGELGDAATARRALEAYLAAEAPERVPGEVRLRLGRLCAAAGERERAVDLLRAAIGGRFEDEIRQRSHAVLALALLYMDGGQLSEAIDLLRAQVSSPLRYGYGETIMLQFALAVAYDRDEQITRAHHSLEQIQGLGEDSLATALVDSASQPVRFVPAIDRHYFAALQYEAMGFLADARRAWQSYAAHEGARYRGRALAHIDAIDALARRRP